MIEEGNLEAMKHKRNGEAFIHGYTLHPEHGKDWAKMIYEEEREKIRKEKEE